MNITGPLFSSVFEDLQKCPFVPNITFTFTRESEIRPFTLSFSLICYSAWLGAETCNASWYKSRKIYGGFVSARAFVYKEIWGKVDNIMATGTFNCEICPNVYVSKLGVKRHMSEHIVEDECKPCGKIIIGKKNFKEHNLLHKERKTYD